MEVRSAVCDASNAEENHDKENNDPSVVILRIFEPPFGKVEYEDTPNGG